MKKFNVKKAVNIAGNIIMLIALVFIVKRIINMDINFSEFGEPKVIAALVLSMIVQTILLVAGCFPWLVFAQSFSGKRIPFSAAMPVYTKSNIYKYLPGNVFQYVGRNKLAADMEISHVDVACATIFDIIFCVAATGIVSLILLGSKIGEMLSKYGKQILIVGIIAVAALAVIVIVIRLKFKDKFKEYISRYAKAFEPANRGKLVQGILYYFLQNAVNAITYFIAIKLIFGSAADTSDVIMLTGAFIFAWIVGFVTIGAPAGIGIRESVMLFVSGAQFEDRVLLFVLVIRFASILADVAAFAIGSIYQKINTNKEKSLG